MAVPLAPRWHTTALIALILAVALTGTVLGANSVAAGAALARERILGAYVPLLVVSWGLTMYVARLGRPRSALGALVGRGWDGFGRASADLFLASVAWLAIETVEAVAGKWRNAAAVALLPHSSFERVAWVLVAMTAGFCEEVIYRGYLQIQLTACTRSAALGIALQATLFGVAHGEQGVGVALRFTLYGILLGVLSRWRRSLVPAILCHVGIDLASGLMAS